ncbi:MAG: PilZ domain-containing protein [Sphingobium sp.]|nr:PilZ domain-containing protein [Sphingobium sp.]MBP6112678.1 PilZ domain-containing protein [Sphingobium sp.]MBP8671810.1 PilZ domain-containing protein [Sphingobium sp.]MBP9158440.1 PilZ domain-containing protein [Sphingobium sp.]MCC6483032.1 PilZ domain-containing protein [Sphingomonadaceae bacterium]
MSFIDQTPLGQTDEPRMARHTVLIGVKLRRPGETWFTSRVSNLSETGFRLHSFVNLKPGMTIWVMFSGFEGRRATVMWTKGAEAGCMFESPLHKAIYEHIMRVSAP